MASRTPALLLALAALWILAATAAAMQLPKAELPPDTPGITFYMYPTPADADAPNTDDPACLLANHHLVLVFHGFKGDHTAKSMRSIKEALLDNEVHNVVLVDWSPLADNRNESALASYQHVRDHGVPLAAAHVSAWLRHVLRVRRIPPDHVHLIGFSLGAHLAGIVGLSLNSTIGRISGLDPPHFGYEDVVLDNRLDAGDAQFVNVIHTSPGILSYSEPIGHCDFFPNGDEVPQASCPHENPIHIITCSHYFSFAIFSETVFNKNAFMATQCDSWLSFRIGLCANNPKAPMGYATPNTTRGTFYIKTKNSVPFGEEDPAHPLPDQVRQLLQYDKKDSIVNPSDVVNFLMHKEPTEPSDEDVVLSAESQVEPEDNSKVMRVKNAKTTSTTLKPPAFLNSSPLPSSGGWILTFILVAFVLTFNG